MSNEPVLTQKSFQEMGLSKPLLKAIAKLGWTHPSEIQAGMIPLALAGRDILGQARTGTGKTAGFALPILQRLAPGQAGSSVIISRADCLAAVGLAP